MGMEHTVSSGTIITSESRPAFPRHVKLQRDAIRAQWVILAPERVFHPDRISVAILKQCDGMHTVSEIAEGLTHEYPAPLDVIESDVTELLQELSDKKLIVV